MNVDGNKSFSIGYFPVFGLKMKFCPAKKNAFSKSATEILKKWVKYVQSS